MNHVSVDIEAFATDVLNHHIQIVQIGACRFDPFTEQGPEELLKDSFLVSLNQVVGWQEDERTMCWWVDQSDEAKRSLNINPMPAMDALDQFTSWLGGHSKGTMLWARPPGFDLVALRKAYEYFDMKTPWHWRNEACQRTVERVASWTVPQFGMVAKAVKADPGLVRHRGDHDAVRQAMVIQRAFAGFSGTQSLL